MRGGRHVQDHHELGSSTVEDSSLADARVVDPTTSRRIDYTCENARFKTDITQGYPHGPQAGAARGSVYADALLQSNGWSLWLEYVADKRGGAGVFWLMWYEPNGKPTMPMSAVFSRADFEEMIGRLARRL